MDRNETASAVKASATFCSSLVTCADGTVEVCTAAEYLRGRRTYVGLEDPSTQPADKPTVAIAQGRMGRAARYVEEGT